MNYIWIHFIDATYIPPRWWNISDWASVFAVLVQAPVAMAPVAMALLFLAVTLSVSLLRGNSSADC